MKICLLGEGSVGKTSIRKRFLGEGLDSSYLITIGADFAVKTVEHGQKAYCFQIWDLAGQPSYSSIRDLYYKGSLGALIIFDLTRPETLPVLEKWVDDLYKYSYKAPLILLGNKSDLKESRNRLVESEEVENFIMNIKEKFGVDIPYFETSALTGHNIDETFLKLGEVVLEDRKWEMMSGF
jgi:small GTP-binding protein